MNQPTPNYLSSLVLQSAKKTIKNGVSGRFLEHHVGTWMGTLLKNVFTGDPWALTPEKTDLYTEKKPDFVISKLRGDDLVIHLICEIKSATGDRMEKALDQAVKDIAMTMDIQGNTDGEPYEIFIIVQRGLDIGFFEYHNDVSNLEEDDIDNLRGCVSLTQDQDNGLAVISRNIPGLKELMYNDENLKGVKDQNIEQMRKEAKKYSIPCIFDLNQHEDEINIMIHHILTNLPRSTY